MSRIKAQLFAAGYKPCQLAEHLARIQWRLTAPHITQIYMQNIPYSAYQAYTQHINHISHYERENGKRNYQWKWSCKWMGLSKSVMLCLSMDFCLIINRNVFVRGRGRRQGMQGGQKRIIIVSLCTEHAAKYSFSIKS